MHAIKITLEQRGDGIELVATTEQAGNRQEEAVGTWLMRRVVAMARESEPAHGLKGAARGLKRFMDHRVTLRVDQSQEGRA